MTISCPHCGQPAALVTGMMAELPRGHRAKWCIHYRYSDGNGLPYATCEAGVEYATLPRLHAQQPCFLTHSGESNPGAAPCEHLRRPTPEEIAQNKAWTRTRMERLGTVMQGIADWRMKHKGRLHSEVVACPACKGRLHLSIAVYNGHVHGRCETGGCVSWME